MEGFLIALPSFPVIAQPSESVMEMDKAALRGVERAVEVMTSNPGQNITIDDLARTALFSKFHFSRVFQRATGISPGRFLSAVRLAEAKRLLVSTSLSVADISCVVGYNSIGTFSSRFRGSVGVPPTRYRRLDGVVPTVPVPEATQGETVAGGLDGEVHQPWGGDRVGGVFVGLFPMPILQGSPARHAVLPCTGFFSLTDVPVGTWYLMSCSIPTGVDQPRYLGRHGPIVIRSGQPNGPFDIELRAKRAIDPPVLLAPLDGVRSLSSAAA
jgi:AraC family transcriptional regulator